jgi:hypothetical protein
VVVSHHDATHISERIEHHVYGRDLLDPNPETPKEVAPPALLTA